MTDEYIRKQDAVDKIWIKADGFEQNYDILYAQGARAMAMVVEQISPADVAPVVFCKDCRKRRKDGYCTKFVQNISGLASAWFMPQDNDFCSYGRRKE